MLLAAKLGAFKGKGFSEVPMMIPMVGVSNR